MKEFGPWGARIPGAPLRSANAYAAADLGFPVGESPNPPGAPTYDFAKFSKKNPHEIEKILESRERPPDPSK